MIELSMFKSTMNRSRLIKSGLLFLFFPLFVLPVLSQQKNSGDSLALVLSKAKHDSDRCAILYGLINLEAPEYSWRNYNDEMQRMASKALENLQTGKPGYLVFKSYLAHALHNKGYAYYQLGDVTKAIGLFSECLKIREQIHDRQGAAYTLNNLGTIYDDQGDAEKAIEYYKKSLSIKEELNDKIGIALSYNNIGYAYKSKGDFEKAEEYYSKSLALKMEIRDKKGIAQSLNNLGMLYKAKEDYTRAIVFYQKGLVLFEEINDKSGMASTLANLGNFYLRKKKVDIAETYALRSMKLSREIKFPSHIRNAAKILSQVYREKGNYKTALEYKELYIQMRDSIDNAQTKKAGIKSQLKYEYEKRAAADSVKNSEEQKVKDAQLVAQGAKLKQEKTQFWFLVCGLSFVVCGLLFVVNRFRITQKQKKIIEEQKLLVDEAFAKLHEKNKEVLDSIYYARRIQRALITSERNFGKLIQQSKNTSSERL
jgi:tetratricopeptide (TPR) repeat protein